MCWATCDWLDWGNPPPRLLPVRTEPIPRTPDTPPRPVNEPPRPPTQHNAPWSNCPLLNLLSNFLKITNSFGERSNPNTYGGKHGKWAIQADQYDNAVSDHTFFNNWSKGDPANNSTGIDGPRLHAYQLHCYFARLQTLTVRLVN